jgi:hypothetical protein
MRNGDCRNDRNRRAVYHAAPGTRGGPSLLAHTAACSHVHRLIEPPAFAPERNKNPVPIKGRDMPAVPPFFLAASDNEAPRSTLTGANRFELRPPGPSLKRLRSEFRRALPPGFHWLPARCWRHHAVLLSFDVSQSHISSERLHFRGEAAGSTQSVTIL